MLKYVRQCGEIDEIRVIRVPLPDGSDEALRAALALYEVAGQKRARIGFSSSLNRCWQRFVVCKELMHLVIDDSSARTPAALEQLSAMTLQITGPHTRVDSEVLAALAAIEYFLPIGERPSELSVDDPEAILRVATKFRLPQHWVRFFYRNQSGFKATSDAYVVPVSVPPKVG